jgi:hypothetical protein
MEAQAMAAKKPETPDSAGGLSAAEKLLSA